MPKFWGNKFSRTGDSPMWVKSRRRRKKEEEEKVGENNGQLRFVCNHVWRTQARLDQKRETYDDIDI